MYERGNRETETPRQKQRQTKYVCVCYFWLIQSYDRVNNLMVHRKRRVTAISGCQLNPYIMALPLPWWILKVQSLVIYYFIPIETFPLLTQSIKITCALVQPRGPTSKQHFSAVIDPVRTKSIRIFVCVFLLI